MFLCPPDFSLMWLWTLLSPWIWIYWYFQTWMLNITSIWTDSENVVSPAQVLLMTEVFRRKKKRSRVVSLILIPWARNSKGTRSAQKLTLWYEEDNRNEEIIDLISKCVSHYRALKCCQIRRNKNKMEGAWLFIEFPLNKSTSSEPRGWRQCGWKCLLWGQWLVLT